MAEPSLATRTCKVLGRLRCDIAFLLITSSAGHSSSKAVRLHVRSPTETTRQPAPATKLVTKTRDLRCQQSASHLGNHEREESGGRQRRGASRTHQRKFVCGTGSVPPFIVLLLEDNTSCARIFEPPATKIFCKRIFGKDIFFPEKL